MTLLQIFLTSVMSVALTFAPKIAEAENIDQAKIKAEVDYLITIRNLTNQVSIREQKLNDLVPIKTKLEYGYSVCQLLDKGASLQDLQNLVVMNNSIPTNSFRYYVILENSAMRNLCPKYKSLLDTFE